MKLILVRHGIAEDKFQFLKDHPDDSLRPLTLKGKKRIQVLAENLTEWIDDLTLIATTPYKRAHQTAEIISKKFPKTLFLDIAEHLNELSHHIHAHVDRFPVTFSIGTGGNIEFLLDFRNQIFPGKPQKFFTYNELLKMILIFKNTPVKDRIEKLKMRKDRADVILPASLVLQTILHQAEVSRVYVPKVGLRDGVIWSMI